jgi:hypothetical protein
MVYIVGIEIPKRLFSQHERALRDDERGGNRNDRPTAIETQRVCSEIVETNKVVFKDHRIQYILKASKAVVPKFNALLHTKISIVRRKHTKICEQKHGGCEPLCGMLFKPIDPWADENVERNIFPSQRLG